MSNERELHEWGKGLQPLNILSQIFIVNTNSNSYLWQTIKNTPAITIIFLTYITNAEVCSSVLSIM